MKYALKKVISLAATLFLVALLVFLMLSVIPGDAALSKLGVDASPEQVEAMRESLGLNENVIVRFFKWFGGMLRFDFGTSIKYGMPVGSLVADKLPVTVWLAALSFIITVLFSVPLGVLASKKRNGILDRTISAVSRASMAIPSFFLGMIVSLLFGLVLKWFTPGTLPDASADFAGFTGYLIFPAVSIAIPKTAMVVCFLRSAITREYSLPYIRTAKSKGVSDEEILRKHVLKNALIPVVTFFGMILAEVLAGSIVIEQVFNLPGIGRLLVVSILNRDFPVVQALIMYIAATVLVVNTVVDIIYKHINPRVRY